MQKRARKPPAALLVVRDAYPKVALVFVVIVLLLRWSGNSTALRLTSLQYKIKGRENLYGKGHDDTYTVGFLIAVLFSVRYLLVNLIFFPLAHILGVKVKKVDSFADQAYQCIWYTLSFATSLYYISLVGFNVEESWAGQKEIGHDNNPHLASSANFKWFYLAEIAFWTHMILTTLLEEWKKDFPMMMAHHVVTSGLLACSYACNFTLIGTFILAEQDLADILLPLAKMAKYASFNAVADIFFVLFALVWIPTRHCVYNFVYLRSIFQLDYKDYKPAIPEEGGYMAEKSIIYFKVALISLQVLLLLWLKELLVAVYKAIGGHVEDHRSDSDDNNKKD